jgi:hypothetical protein
VSFVSEKVMVSWQGFVDWDMSRGAAGTHVMHVTCLGSSANVNGAREIA